MNYIPPLPGQLMNRYTDGSPSTAPAQFPKNLAGDIDAELTKKILLWLNTKYIWPQIQERMQFEAMWDKMLNMSRITMPASDLWSNVTQDNSRAKQTSDQSNRDKARVADSVVHDAIQRLTDITYFIAFKDGVPAQFSIPPYVRNPYESPEYRPLADRVAAGNALVDWNSGNHHVRRNSLLAYRHHYTYGVAFCLSDFQFRVQMINRRQSNGQIAPIPEITNIGTTFEPISLRKLWLNWRLPVYDMNVQPCPFWFDETPRFAILQNQYHPVQNPFGYQNLDKLAAGTYIYSDSEMESVRRALQSSVNQMSENGGSSSVAQILEPEYSVEAKWTMMPMMPFDPVTGEFEMRQDGETPVPFQRFVVEMFGPNIHSGQQTLLRLQQNYYPSNELPLYASSHMPDLDSGAYAPSIGQLLYNHYKEICLCMEQYFENKDWINDPPSWCQTASPAFEKDRNEKGATIPVNGPNDFGWRTPYDATGTTVAMMQLLREGAQTTGKVVDAIMGKAMGGRTTATEASNAYQASMSAITTDIDMVTHDLHGNYIDRVWKYTGAWFDPDLLFCITGQFGFAIKLEDMWINLGIKTNVGSTYVEKIVQQQNHRYLLESTRGEPGLNRMKILRNVCDSMGFDGAELVEDGGREQQIQLATMQACETYLGNLVLVDPDQDHQIAIKVKTSFIKDQKSVWNTTPNYAANAPALIEQIQQHDKILQLQLQAQLLQQQMQVLQANFGIKAEEDQAAAQKQNGRTPPSQPRTPGELAQQGAGVR